MGCHGLQQEVCAAVDDNSWVAGAHLSQGPHIAPCHIWGSGKAFTPHTGLHLLHGSLEVLLADGTGG